MQFNCIMVAVETGKSDVTGEEICSEICGNLSQYYQTQEFWGPFSWKRMLYCIVFGEKENFFMSTLIHLLKKYIRDLAEKRPGVYINMGIGYWVDDIRKLQYAADTAVQALEYRFVLGRNQVFHIHDLRIKNYLITHVLITLKKNLRTVSQAAISAVIDKSAQRYGIIWRTMVSRGHICFSLSLPF